MMYRAIQSFGRSPAGAKCRTTGDLVATATFFVAPLFGLLWAYYLWRRRNQRELPYGPWLAAAAAVVMIFHDSLAVGLKMYIDLFAL